MLYAILTLVFVAAPALFGVEAMHYATEGTGLHPGVACFLSCLSGVGLMAIYSD